MKKLLSLGLILVLGITLSGCNDDNNDDADCTSPKVIVNGECVDPDPIYGDIYFSLIGNETVVVEVGDIYYDKGFIARDDQTPLQDYVTVTGNVNLSEVGEYIVTYTLDYQDVETVLKRTVIVVEPGLNDNCDEVEGTTLLLCQKTWTQYLHTVVKLKVYIEKDSAVDSELVFFQIENTLAYYNKTTDKYKAYDGIVNINTINANPTATHTVDEQLFEVIKFTLDHQGEVNNLFNAALGPVLQIWHDYRENCNNYGTCEVPLMDDLLAKKQYTNPADITLDEVNHTITMKEHMSLDLGGVSKGFISGKIIDYLDSLEIHGYLLNNGESNISIGGDHPTRENGQFLLAVTDPEFIKPYYATIYLSDGDQLVTSGDYQQYYTANGEYFHHIIHNDTLMPERYNRSVSIITSDPALADLYSTAIFLMTVEEGKTFVNAIDGLEAIWYDIDGNIHFSENFETQYLNELN